MAWIHDSRFRGMMGLALAAAWGWWMTAGPALGQGTTIWRCGNEYTNNPGPNPAARGCREVQGANLTIVEGARPATSSTAPSGTAGSTASGSAAAANGARSPAERVDPDQQRQRDAEARRILEQELRRAEERLAQARADYADGKPPRLADERTDSPRYQARVEELRTRVERAQADVAAIRREIDRLGGGR